MPAAANISLNDSTPAAHTFEPQSILPERSVLVDRDSTTSGGFKTLQAGLSPARPSRPTNRVNLRLSMPTEQTVDTVTSVAYTARCNIDVVLPEEMTTTERAHFAAFVKNMLADSVINGYIEDLDPMY
jgi:hypothetical protein